MTHIFRVLALLCICHFGYAQSSTASPYSYNGLGDLNFRGNEFNRQMSGLEVYNDSIHVSLSNPTSYARLKTTTYSLGIHYKSTRLESESSVEDIPSGTIDYLGIGIPVGSFGFGFLATIVLSSFNVIPLCQNSSPFKFKDGSSYAPSIILRGSQTTP